MKIIIDDDDLEYYEKTIIEYLSGKIAEIDDFEILAEGLSEVETKYFSFYDLLIKLVENLLKKAPFTSTIPKNVMEYFDEIKEQDPIEFMLSYMPNGFDISNPEHIVWANSSLDKQQDDSLSNLMKLLQSHPDIIEKTQKLNFNSNFNFLNLLKFTDSENNQISINEVINQFKQNLPDEIVELGTDLLNELLGPETRSNQKIKMMDQVPKIYSDAFDNILTHILRPMIGSSSRKLPHNVMRMSVNDIMAKRVQLFPKNLNHILDNMDPDLRNAFIHKTYIIKEENEISYFVSPWKSPFSNKIKPLQFDQKISIEELWAKAFLLTMFHLMFSLMKFMSFNKLISNFIKPHMVSYLLWNPIVLNRNELVTPLNLMQYFRNLDYGNPDQLETGILMELLFVSKIGSSRFITMDEKPYNAKEHASTYWERVAKEDNPILLGLCISYMIYLISCDIELKNWEPYIKQCKKHVPESHLNQFSKELEMAQLRKLQTTSSNIFKDIAKTSETVSNKIQELKIELDSIENEEMTEEKIKEKAKINRTIEKHKQTNSILNALSKGTKISFFSDEFPYSSIIRFQSLLRGLRDQP
ncbi:MAG: hypothetical protein HeimC2_00520 [Candidatus Heimdallarchaeota archaeon LC_2]|nr:MAG: hypothetical protein HeimC2_00520 [Candidatus Heimdallarchaeota archaeon LC_2]